MGIAVDGSGSAYVTGLTTSGLSTRSCEAGCFPTTSGAFDRILGGGQDAFVTKLNPSGTALVYSTFLGSTLGGVGTSFDHGIAIAVDSAGAAYVTGVANGPNFPLTADAVDVAVVGSANDAFLTKVSPDGNAILYSTFLGGSAGDTGNGVALDGLGHAYVSGATQSADLPVTSGAFDATLSGPDAFVARLSIESSSTPATLTLTSLSLVNSVGTIQTLTAAVADANGQPVGDTLVRFTVAGIASTSGQCTTGADGRCAFSYQGPTTPGTDAIAAFADTDRDGIEDSSEPSATAAATWVVGPPASVTIAPPADSSTVSSEHCVTAIVTDAFGNPVTSAIVRFTITGALTITALVTSDTSGQAIFCYTGPAFPGADDITAHADADGDGLVDTGEPVAHATNTWLLPEATPGQVTGGGQAPALNDTAEIAFGFNAKSTADGADGNCNVVDQAADVHFKCLAVTSLVRDGGHATIFGSGTLNGAVTSFRIDVDDQGEPGTLRDSFRIVTSNGYAAGGVLARGNIQVR